MRPYPAPPSGKDSMDVEFQCSYNSSSRSRQAAPNEISNQNQRDCFAIKRNRARWSTTDWWDYSSDCRSDHRTRTEQPQHRRFSGSTVLVSKTFATTSTTNLGSSSSTQQLRRYSGDDKSDHLIHPKLIGRFIPRAAVCQSASSTIGASSSSQLRPETDTVNNTILSQKNEGDDAEHTVKLDMSGSNQLVPVSSRKRERVKSMERDAAPPAVVQCFSISATEFYCSNNSISSNPDTVEATPDLTEVSSYNGGPSVEGPSDEVVSTGRALVVWTKLGDCGTSNCGGVAYNQSKPVEMVNVETSTLLPVSICDQHEADGSLSSVVMAGTSESQQQQPCEQSQLNASVKTPTNDIIVTGQSATADNDVVAKIHVGARVSVYWDGENKYFKGTVTKERKHRKNFFLEYDDGDREWINFSEHRFRLLNASTKRRGSKNSQPSVQTAKTGTKRKMPIDERKEVVMERIATSLKPNTNSSISSEFDHQIELVKVKRRKYARRRMPATESDWVSAGMISAFDSSSESDTDDEEIMQWAAKMFGIAVAARPTVAEKQDTIPAETRLPKEYSFDDPVHIPISEKVKLGRRRSSSTHPKQPIEEKAKVLPSSQPSVQDLSDEDKLRKLEEEAQRKKDSARPLSAAAIAAILGEESPYENSLHWVRRSIRQPSKSILNSPKVKALLDKLRSNDTDMIVLKMKKYVNDPNTPQIVIDAVLDALEENTNCEALYIQNFNEGMQDKQVLKLVQILQRPTCKIWCLNIGETYKVKTSTWQKFAMNLIHTKITHMYASEHTITPELKDAIRTTIRMNRTKHNMHNDPDNLDTIIQCTHCWWNPINASNLRPYVHKRGYEHILNDMETQGLRGTTTGATLGGGVAGEGGGGEVNLAGEEDIR